MEGLLVPGVPTLTLIVSAGDGGNGTFPKQHAEQPM